MQPLCLSFLLLFLLKPYGEKLNVMAIDELEMVFFFLSFDENKNVF